MKIVTNLNKQFESQSKKIQDLQHQIKSHKQEMKTLNERIDYVQKGKYLSDVKSDNMNEHLAQTNLYFLCLCL